MTADHTPDGTVATTGAATGEEPGRRGLLRSLDDPGRAVRTGLLAIVILPIVVAVVRALRRDWFPIGDDALLYIRVRDVLTGHHPLLGSWSSASLSLGTHINNPGPLYDDLAAPFAHLFSPGPGAALGAAAINVAAVVGASAASRHVGGWPMQRWFLLAAAALSWTMGSELLFDIWQAHALLLPFLCFLVLLIGIATSRTRCVPWAVFVGSLLVQTHISYAYILAIMIPAAIVLAWWGERAAGRTVDRRRFVSGLRSRTAIVSAVVFVAVWAQTLVEQLAGEGRGNLSRLVSNAGGGDVTLGFRNATKIVAAVAVLPPWWTRRGFSTIVPITRLTDTPDGTVIVIPGLPGMVVAALAVGLLVVVLAVTARACARRARRVEATAAVLAAAAILATVVCLGMLTVGRVGLAPHHVRWTWTLAVAVHTVAAWTVTTVLLDVRRERRARHAGDAADDIAGPLGGADVGHRWVGAAVVGATVLLSAAALPFQAHDEGPVGFTEAMPALREVFRQLGSPEQRDVLEAAAPIVYDVSNLRVFEPYSSTVMMRFQELGIEFRVTDEVMVRQLGESRRADGSETATIMQLEGSNALLHDGPECPVAFGNALPAGARAAAATAADVLAAGLVDGTLFVEPTALPDDERVRYDAALGGDVEAARRLVYEGYVTRWAEAGTTTIDAATTDALAATLADVPESVVTSAGSVTTRTFDLIDRWVVSSYGLFGTGTLCPT